MKHVVAVLALLCLLVGLAVSAADTDRITIVPVHFAQGADRATLRGSFAGYDSLRYTLSGKAGQTLAVRMAGSPRVSFKVFRPGDPPDTARAIGVGGPGSDWQGRLPASGEYVVQLFQTAADARRGGRADVDVSFAMR